MFGKDCHVFNAGTANAVSYTHLDVYKRQDNRIKKEVKKQILLNANFKINRLTKIRNNFEKNKAYETVSYTHLDVYKRQTKKAADNIVLAKCGIKERIEKQKK